MSPTMSPSLADQPTSSAPSHKTVRVFVDEMKFYPAHVTIRKGTTVRWEPTLRCTVTHCLEVVDTEEENQASSPALVPGSPWEHTFTEPGDFHYRSLIYCFMKGTVTVVEGDEGENRTGALEERRRESLMRGMGESIGSEKLETLHTENSSVDDDATTHYSRLPSDDEETGVDVASVGTSSDAALETTINSTLKSSTSTSSAQSKEETKTSPKKIHPPPESLVRAMERSRREASLGINNSELPSVSKTKCDRCSMEFVSLTNHQRHKASHAKKGKRVKVPQASLEDVCNFWNTLSPDAQKETLLVSQPGEAGALVASGLKARGSSEEIKSNDPGFAKYQEAGVTLSIAAGVFDAENEPTIATEVLFQALACASEGTCFGPPVNVDFTVMLDNGNLEAALAFYVEKNMLTKFLDERSAEAENAQRLLLAEIDETNAEEERREKQRLKNKAKKAKNKVKRRGEAGEVSGFSEVEEEGAEDVEEVEGEEAVDLELTAQLRALQLEQQRQEEELSASVACEAAERDAREAAAASAKAGIRRQRLDFRGDSAKGGGVTPVKPEPKDNKTKKSDKMNALPLRPTTAPVSRLTIPVPRVQTPESNTQTVVVKPVSDVVPKPYTASAAMPREAAVLKKKQSRRKTKLERLEAREAGIVLSTTDASGASGSDVGFTDIEFGVPSSLTGKHSRKTRREGKGAMPVPEVVSNEMAIETPVETFTETPTECFTPTATPTKPMPTTPVAMFASSPPTGFAHSNIPVAQVWTPERDFGSGHHHARIPYAYQSPPMPMGVPPMMQTAPMMAHPTHMPMMVPPMAPPAHMHHAAPPAPVGIDPKVYMHHYLTALAAIQNSQPQRSVPYAPPLPPGPPPGYTARQS